LNGLSPEVCLDTVLLRVWCDATFHGKPIARSLVAALTQ
jgi:hypothetical protein